MEAALKFEALYCSGERLAARTIGPAGGLCTLGLREGDAVAVLLRNCRPFIDMVNACRVAGVHDCPIHWHFTAAEVRYLLEGSGA